MSAASIALVACCSRKASAPTLARDLYQGDLFRKSVALVEQRRLPWFVLSAKHGVLEPGELVAPYNFAMADLGRADRERWARRACTAIALLVEPCAVLMLAGVPYREWLAPMLEDRGFVVETPLEGLGIGRQKQRLVELAKEENQCAQS